MTHLTSRFNAVLIAVAVFLVAPLSKARADNGGSGSSASSASHFKHVVTIVLENQDYSMAIADPYLKELASQGALFSHFEAAGHPSYPNYLAMVAGDSFGVRTDIQKDLDERSIVDLLEEKGLSWKSYAENYPGNCFLGATAPHYARKHVPLLSFKSIQDSPARCANVVDANEFNSDLRQLPNYSFYSPNLEDDGHNSSLQTASAWLKSFLTPLLSQPEVMKDTLLIITFDESKSSFSSSNQVYTVLLGGMVKPGTIVDTPQDFYGLLKTIESNFGLGSLNNEQSREPISSIWK